MYSILILLIIYCLITSNIISNAKQCFIDSTYHNIKYPNVKDQSWIEYLTDVYDYRTRKASYNDVGITNHIQFYYLNSNVRIVSLAPVHHLSDSKFSTRFLINKNYKVSIASHSWVEVFRYNINHLTKNFPSEGFTSPNWTVNHWKYYNSTKVPYGCWFYYAPGSGIYINVGNVLMMQNKYDKEITHQVLGNYLNPYGCMDGDPSKHCYDKYFCKAVLAKGYDSIFFANSNELIICSGKCATEEVKGSCPPIDLRTRGGGEYYHYPTAKTTTTTSSVVSAITTSSTELEKCNCSEESYMLNCGKYLQAGGLFNSITNPVLKNTGNSSSYYYRPFTCVNEGDTVDKDSAITSSTSLNYDLKIIFSNKYHSYDLINNSISVDEPLFGTQDNILYLCTKLLDSTANKSYHSTTQLSISTSNGIRKLKYASFDSEKDTNDVNNVWQSAFSEYTWLSIDNQLYPLIDNSHMKLINTVIIEPHLFDGLRLQLGIILYDMEYADTLLYNDDDGYTRMRQLQDESMCLQKAGAVFIVLVRNYHSTSGGSSNDTMLVDNMSSSIDDLQHLYSKNLKGYIDLILIVNNNREVSNEVNCTTSDSDTLIPIMYISTTKESSNQVALASISTRSTSTNIQTRMLIVNKKPSNENKVLDQITFGTSNSTGIMRLVLTNTTSQFTPIYQYYSNINPTNNQSSYNDNINDKVMTSMEILYPTGKSDSLYNELDDLYLTIFSDNILIIPDIKVASDRYLVDIIFSNSSINDSSNNYSMYSYMQWPNWPDRDSCYQNFKLQHSGRINHVLKNINISHSTTIDHQINNINTSTASIVTQINQTLRYCNAEDAFRGNFIIPNKIPSSGILPLQSTALFEAYGCILKALPDKTKSRSSSIEKIPSKHYLFLGDSTLELVFKGVINRIFGEETFHIRNNRQHSWVKYIKSFITTNPLNEENRWFDYYNYDNNNKISYPRFSFMFNGGPKPVDNMIGAALSGFPWYKQKSNKYIDSYYFLELMRIVKESILNCTSLTIFYNTGAHDIASKLWNHNYSYKLYEQGLNQSFAKLKNFIEYEINQRTNIDICPRDRIQLKLYWVTTVPFFIFHKTSRWQCGYIYGNKGHKKLNDISIPLATMHGYEVLDQYRMRYAFPIDGDGVHCQKYYYMPGPINVSSCNLLINSFLHVLQL